MVGGLDETFNIINKVERYDVIENTWTLVSPMCEERWRQGIAVVNGKIMVFGGIGNNTIEEYDAKQDTWKNVGTDLVNYMNQCSFPLTIKTSRN